MGASAVVAVPPTHRNEFLGTASADDQGMPALKVSYVAVLHDKLAAYAAIIMYWRDLTGKSQLKVPEPAALVASDINVIVEVVDVQTMPGSQPGYEPVI
jgi:hypothetical protein